MDDTFYEKISGIMFFPVLKATNHASAKFLNALLD